MQRKLLFVLLLAILGIGALFFRSQTREEPPFVTLYTSVDQVYSEPVIRAFTQKTGIEVKVLYDAEAAKTVGLVNRLIAEKDKPLADIFWNGEFMHMLALKDAGILASYSSPQAKGLPDNFRHKSNLWTAFGGRARTLIVNGKSEPLDGWPTSLKDLIATDTPIAVANPLFGSTATHAAALAAQWGEDETMRFFEKLKTKGVRFVGGNSVVRDLVASGQIPMGLTDTDDACVAILGDAAVDVVFLDQGPSGMGTLIVPNMLAMIKGGPNPEKAQILFDYLISVKTEAALVKSGWVQIPSRKTDARPKCYEDLDVKGMALSFSEIRAAGARIQPRLRALFQN